MADKLSMNKVPKRVLCASVFLLAGCDARKWKTLVDPAIYASAVFDPNRVEHITEHDPFDYPEATESSMPTATPSQRTAESGEASVAPSRAPAIPTDSPTSRDEKVLDNGDCALDHFLYKVKMHDRWGDGWDKTSLKILQMPENVDEEGNLIPFVGGDNTTHTFSATASVHTERNKSVNATKHPTVIFQGSLESGSSEFSYVCLKPGRCYEVNVDGGIWENEIKWDITSAPVSLFEQYRRNGATTVAKGFAPAHCQFSIPLGETEDLACPFTCELDRNIPVSPPTESPTGMPMTSPTDPPTEAPSLLPSLALSEAPSLRTVEDTSAVPSDAPSLIPTASSTAPSDAPSLVPTSFGSHPPSDMPSLVPSTIPASQDEVSSYYSGTVPASTTAPSLEKSNVPSDAPSLVPSTVPSSATLLN